MPEIQISERLISFLYFLPVFFLSLAIHEFAHAYTANIKGDSTAKDFGRLTLNPIKHLDIVGSVLMPIAAFASGFALIGWAKPVPVNRKNFKNPLKDDAFVSAAGPISNFILAVFLFLIFAFLDNTNPQNYETAKSILWFGTFFNIFLFVFNLLPIPPLDGSHILFDLFPNKFTAKLLNLGFYGTFILFIFIYSPLWDYFFALVNFILKMFLYIKSVF
ncbi:MAG: site-2 protease family protein [Melioribacteraceae bacterium]|nr:MAG: site-2 protease family protein [Melioribacteraceae bacterium]